MTERINDRYLKDFFGLDDSDGSREELEEIKQSLIREIYENGADICTIDDEADGMYFIESGRVVVLNRDGEQVNVLNIGQYFGEYAVLSGEKRLTTVRAVGRVVVYRMESAKLMSFLSEHPNIYSELMKRVYGQLSSKHTRILELSRNKRGILIHPDNDKPPSFRQTVIQCGFLAVTFLLSALLIPRDAGGPVFLVPLIFMTVYVIITKRTLESLIVSGMLAAMLTYRMGFLPGFTDALMETMGAPDNVFTVLVMVLMGALISLIINSGGVTAFERAASGYATSRGRIYLLSLGIMVVTGIDDGLNMLCASYALHNPAKEKGIVREKLALFYSMLPTVICSFIPLSLWGIFVIGTVSASAGTAAIGLFCRSIPFNFFSIITLIVMIFFAAGIRIPGKQLSQAEERYRKGGALWPAGSERYLQDHDKEVWGRISDVMLPIAVLAAASLLLRSVFGKSFSFDSAVGLTAAIAFTYILYCSRKIMTPEKFMEYLVEGISESTLPVMLYLLTMCFSAMLDQLRLHEYYEDLIEYADGVLFLFPAVVFIFSVFLTMVLGSSWAMYAIAFPIVLKLAGTLGINPVILMGAITGAGIAGEKNCRFTSEAANIANAVGINPDAALNVRRSFSIPLTALTAVCYLIAGYFMTGTGITP